MACQHRCIRIARLFGLAILRLGQAVVALASPVEVVSLLTAQSTLHRRQSQPAIPNRATQFKQTKTFSFIQTCRSQPAACTIPVVITRRVSKATHPQPDSPEFGLIHIPGTSAMHQCRPCLTWHPADASPEARRPAIPSLCLPHVVCHRHRRPCRDDAANLPHCPASPPITLAASAEPLVPTRRVSKATATSRVASLTFRVMSGGGRILSRGFLSSQPAALARPSNRSSQSPHASSGHHLGALCDLRGKSQSPTKFLANPATNDCEPTRHNPPRKQGHGNSQSASLTYRVRTCSFHPNSWRIRLRGIRKHARHNPPR
ncbi:hypothetical protein RESH_00344 [Rhodopirellula europaea SH398]|uniref:Uncharacterized protein n=1 Tax=Rhodopirellula europaea SH398 TaxID=1263868 RepID=M5SS20_9BACT|nr:hypothetical protein RESH_00344 [Rhodopirellula europaea SH398]